jgi:hypothetical protein
MPKRRWSDLSERTRRLLVAAAVADGALRIAALVDIKRRPEGQIRGRKQVWAALVAIVNSAGLVPISYFVFGRRRQPLSQPPQRGPVSRLGPGPAWTSNQGRIHPEWLTGIPRRHDRRGMPVTAAAGCRPACQPPARKSR